MPVGCDHLDVPALHTASIRTRGATSSDHEVEFELPAWDGALSMSAREFREEPSATRKILLTIDDVTEIKEGEAQARFSHASASSGYRRGPPRSGECQQLDAQRQLGTERGCTRTLVAPSFATLAKMKRVCSAAKPSMSAMALSVAANSNTLASEPITPPSNAPTESAKACCAETAWRKKEGSPMATECRQDSGSTS